MNVGTGVMHQISAYILNLILIAILDYHPMRQFRIDEYSDKMKCMSSHNFSAVSKKQDMGTTASFLINWKRINVTIGIKSSPFCCSVDLGS